MKKVVIFTLAMVLALSSMALAFVDNNDENAAAVFGAQAATTGGENIAANIQGNPVAVNGSQAATNGGTNVDVQAQDFLKNNTNNDNSNQNNLYVVDNQVLANVNLGGPIAGNNNNGGTINKTQSAEIERSFNRAVGVSNVNNAAGNLNSQTAATSISVKF